MYEPLEKKIRGGKIGFYRPTGEKLRYKFSRRPDPWNHLALDEFLKQDVTELVIGGKDLQNFLCWGNNIRGLTSLLVQMSYQRGVHPMKIDADFEYLKKKKIWVPRQFRRYVHAGFPKTSSFEKVWYISIEDAKAEFGRSHGMPRNSPEWESSIADHKIYFPFGGWLGK